MSAPRLPEELRRAVAADLQPVKPLAPPWRRALALAAWVPAAAFAVVSVLHLRHDAPAMGAPLTWLPLAWAGAVGFALVALALAEAIPGRAVPRPIAVALLGAGAAGFFATSFLTSSATPGTIVANPLLTKGPACLTIETLVGLTALALVALLLRAARPLRASWALLLGGAGAGLLAEGVYRLHCSISDLRHVLPWHGGGIALLVLVALAAAAAWERGEARRLRATLRNHSS